ncbi:MAG: hypothetical protein LBH40_04705 [Alphaproteobacteria bacterium]|jgi:myo-inositol-1(or 4)-monophosphatase|nr:hypothetical protein [Alphaproteobacteria bacterium]
MKTPLINLMTIAINKVTNSIIRDFNEINFLLNNPTAALNFALTSNVRAQRLIYDDLKKFKETYSAVFKNLEIASNKDESNFFIISGIVGMKNFSKGIPNFCISVALERDSQIFASVIFNPITNEIFYAEKGNGAYCNNKRIRISENKLKDTSYHTTATDLEYLKDSKNFVGNPYISNCKALDICYFAASKINNCFYAEKSPIYDLSPSLLIASEAGFLFDIEYDILENKKEKHIIKLSNKEIR